MAHELRIIATVPLGDDTLGNASVMGKLDPAVKAFQAAVAKVVAETAFGVKLVKVRDAKLSAPPGEPSPEPPAELSLEQPDPSPAAKADKKGGAPWLKQHDKGEAA